MVKKLQKQLLVMSAVLSMIVSVPGAGISVSAAEADDDQPVIEQVSEETLPDAEADIPELEEDISDPAQSIPEIETEEASSEVEQTVPEEEEVVSEEENDIPEVVLQTDSEAELQTAVKEDTRKRTYHDDFRINISSIEELSKAEGISETEIEATTATLPSSYRTPYITSVKDQNPYGTCWAHAFVSAAESNMIKNKLADSNVNLSELHLAYFMYHPATDPLGGLAGDDFYLTGDENFLDGGGNDMFATFLVSSWQGLADESTAPYSNADYDLVLKDSIAYKDAAHLENAYWISMSDPKLVKAALKKYGAAAVSYYDDDIYYNQESCWYCENPLAIYCPDYRGTNHSVTLVGWDDNFSKNNFGTYKPSKNGAWLIKNSWGSDFGNDGYCWISYEDIGLNYYSDAEFYIMGPADNYDYNYQYDGSIDYAVTTEHYKQANVYTATSNQTLEAVGFYTADALYDYKITIYKNCKSSSPTGAVMTSQSGRETYAGFHTVELNTPIALKKGEKFSVVIEQSTSASDYLYIYYDESLDEEGVWFGAVSSAKPGQSYLYNGNAWTDISESGGNCKIKAYTKKGISADAKMGVTGLKLNKSSVDILKGKTYQLKGTVTPSDATNKQLNWISSDTSVATVNSKGVVTAKKVGKATITCKAKDGSGIKANCTVTVKQPVTSITLDYSTASAYTGMTLPLTAKVSPSNAANKKVTWKSSNTAVATVNSNGVVTAKKAGTATITCTAADGSKVAGKCIFTVMDCTKTQAFVVRLYIKCLGRQVDPSGYDHWCSVLNNHERSGAQVAYGFVFSDEYKNKNTTDDVFVTMLYQVFMDRQPDADGKQHWLDLLSQGVSREFVFSRFVQSEEYTQICQSYGIDRGTFTVTQARDQNVNVTMFVNRLYVKALGRSWDESGINHWCNEILTKNRTPEQVAEAFITSPEFRNKNLSDEEYIKVLYMTFLGREYDQSGLAHWKGELARGCSRDEILHRFATSAEFRQIQASFGL